MFTSIKKIIYSALKNFFRNNGFSIATIFILVITLLLVNTLFLLKDASQSIFSELQEKVDLSVYFDQDVSEQEILGVKQTLERFQEIKDVEYISKAQALQDFTQRHKDDPILMESIEELGSNPFFASLNITSWEASQYSAVSEFLEKGDFKNLITKVDYFQKKPVIEKIFSITSSVNKTVIFLSIVLSLIAILVAFNQIRLAIVNSKEEIKVMRLVGATNGFIRGPFIVQGVIAGIFAALIATIVFGSVCFFLAPKAEFFVPGLNIFEYFVSNFFVLASLQLIIGIGLGTISSMFAMRKYLKV